MMSEANPSPDTGICMDGRLMDMTDDELYRQYLSGDQAAGDELMLRYGDALTAYLDAFLHNAQDAEDLMLDCFTVILVNKPVIAEGHFSAYLFKVARNKANHLWKVRFRRREFSLDDSLLSGDDSPEDMIRKNERDRILYRCLNRIDPKYREALFLVYDQGMSYAQAAEIKGCGAGRIHYLLDEGKKRMHKELEKEGITHEDI